MFPAAYTLTARPLTPDEANVLHHELKTTPNILGYLPRELLRFSRVWVAHAESGDFAGACLCKDLMGNWTDVAVLYVLPAFRGSGLSRRLFETALADARTRGRHVYVLSRSLPVIHLMQSAGMKLSRSPWTVPLAVSWDTHQHMNSVYRWREAFRKSPQRKADGNGSFVAGTLRFDRKSG